MATVRLPARRVIVAAAATALALAPLAGVFAVSNGGPPPYAVAQDDCGSSDTTDDYTLSCVPNMVVPDTSDQLTEAEVASPGYNASPGGGGMGGGGMGGGGGHR